MANRRGKGFNKYLVTFEENSLLDQFYTAERNEFYHGRTVGMGTFIEDLLADRYRFLTTGKSKGLWMPSTTPGLVSHPSKKVPSVLAGEQYPRTPEMQRVLRRDSSSGEHIEMAIQGDGDKILQALGGLDEPLDDD